MTLHAQSAPVAAGAAAQLIRLMRIRDKIEKRAAALIDWLDELDALAADLEPDADFEEDADLEDGADDEPSLGALHATQGGSVWFDQAYAWACQTTDDREWDVGDDREEDPAESGVADVDGYREQFTGEPSLGWGDNLDQRLNERPVRSDDGEASGTIEDVDLPRLAYEDRLKVRAAAQAAGEAAARLAQGKAKTTPADERDEAAARLGFIRLPDGNFVQKDFARRLNRAAPADELVFISRSDALGERGGAVAP